MNQIAIVIRVNDRQVAIGARWPTIETLKALAQFKLAEMKRKINDIFFKVAMAIVPMPQCAVA